MTSTLAAPAGSLTRPAPSVIDARWIERGVGVCERVLDVVLTTRDQSAVAEVGASIAKVVAESAILLRILKPWHHCVLAARLAERLAVLAVDPRTLTALALHASAAFELAVPYLVLRERHRDDRVDDLLHTAFAARAAQGRELLPHRALERLWLLGLLTGRREFTRTDLEATVLAREIDLLHGTRDDHYAFTHALMYATDFGRDPDAVPADWKPRLVDQARSALAGALDEDDYDLAGELLLTWPFLRETAGPVESTALMVLCDVADAVGTLPSLTLALVEGTDRLPAADAVVLSTYHTSFVFTALAALAPRVEWRTSAANGPSLRATRPSGGRRPGWLDVPAAGLPAGPLGLEAGVRRAVREHRLADVAALLSAPGTPATPATNQALQLLERLSLLP